MRLKIIVLLTIFSMIATAPIMAAGPRAGSKCPLEGFVQSEGSKTFTCTKVGKKLKWKNTSKDAIKYDISKTYSTDGGYFDNIVGGPCAEDPLVPEEWKAMQEFSRKYGGCGGQLRIAKYELGTKRPATIYDPASNFQDISQCKLTITKDWDRTGLDTNPNSWRKERAYPGPNTVIQLIPIYSDDSAKPKNSPQKDYEKYLRYLKEWIDYSSDFGSDTKFRIPDQYIKFDKNIADYNLFHPVSWETPGHVRFNKDVIETVDPAIDFKGANIGIIVSPPGTDAKIMQQAALGSFQTSEGLVPVGFSQFADIPSNPYGSTYRGLTHPFWWIHEAYHAGFGFDDRYGDMKLNINTEYGMGWWTMMTPWGGDLSIWEKWVLGFVKDSQMQCRSGNSVTTHWIAPSSVKTKESKAVVIPLSQTKAIVVESIRSAGLYYKHPEEIVGALVYDIDLERIDHGMSMKLGLPKNRTATSAQFFLSGATLKKGDHTIIDDYKITVVEAGTYGDVVKVEKI